MIRPAPNTRMPMSPAMSAMVASVPDGARPTMLPPGVSVGVARALRRATDLA